MKIGGDQQSLQILEIPMEKEEEGEVDPRSPGCRLGRVVAQPTNGCRS
jgi:hypothetical protein